MTAVNSDEREKKIIPRIYGYHSSDSYLLRANHLRFVMSKI